MAKVCVEICVDSLQSVDAAVTGYVAAMGADGTGVAVGLRLELCSALYQGGLTPSAGFVVAACRLLEERAAASPALASTRCRAMLRNRPGLDYCYSPADMAEMVAEAAAFGVLRTAHEAVARRLDGVVFGALDAHRLVDTAAVKVIAAAAADAGIRHLTVHRAVDDADDPVAAVQGGAECATGSPCNLDCILSSGGAPSAAEGIAVLQRMATAAAPYGIAIMPGSGVSDANAAQLLAATVAVNGQRYVHASAKMRRATRPDDPPSETCFVVDAARVTALVGVANVAGAPTGTPKL